MIESGEQLLEVLGSWAERLPQPVTTALEGVGPKSSWGERHGTWFLRLTWARDDGLLRIAEVAVTQAGALPLVSATNVHFSVRAAATTDLRYVITTLYSRQRSVLRLTADSMTDQLIAAVRAAETYV